MEGYGEIKTVKKDFLGIYHQWRTSLTQQRSWRGATSLTKCEEGRQLQMEKSLKWTQIQRKRMKNHYYICKSSTDGWNLCQFGEILPCKWGRGCHHFSGQLRSIEMKNVKQTKWHVGFVNCVTSYIMESHMIQQNQYSNRVRFMWSLFIKFVVLTILVAENRSTSSSQTNLSSAFKSTSDKSGAKSLYIIESYDFGSWLNRLLDDVFGDMIIASVKKGNPELRERRERVGQIWHVIRM
jgi:hypothetical protein